MKNITVENMTSERGNDIANQFIITHTTLTKTITYFQSYDSIIVKQVRHNYHTTTYLDKNYWNYSRNTSKYRNIFLGEHILETQAKINSGEYKLVDLN